MLYEATVSFLNNCQQPKHLEGRTLVNMQTFGLTCLLPDVQQKLHNWATAMIHLA